LANEWLVKGSAERSTTMSLTAPSVKEKIVADRSVGQIEHHGCPFRMIAWR